MYPKLLEKLVSFYKRLPTIGEKTAERLALATIEFDEDIIREFSNDILIAKEKLGQCKTCGLLTDSEECAICSDPARNHNLFCVIEDFKSAFSIEKAGNYNGVYHVLNGLITPIKNIGPENINFSSLVKRVENAENPEVIVALKSSIEGQTTTLYINKKFENKGVVVSRLAYGIPVGTELEYLDLLTLDKALEDRVTIS